jgi:chaperonin GroES
MIEEVDAVTLDSVRAGIERLYENKEERVLNPELVDKPLLERMPDPTGWRVLILPYRGKGRTEGGIYIPDKVLDDGQLQTVVGYVLKVGPLAYKDEEKFPQGPWCQQGDWVIFARYAGSRFRIDGGEVRILNDDEILARILDPEDVLHV